MRILVYPHELGMGGSQLNAIQLASAVREHGHEVVVYGQPGPLVATIHDYGLEFLPAPAPGRRPSPSVVRHLRATIRDRGIDVVHGYEWPPILEAALACRGLSAVAMGTVLSMSVAPFIPRGVPLAVGTEQIAAAERLGGRPSVFVLEPPVDLTVDDPTEVDGHGWRASLGLADDEVVVGVVSRLAAELKLEGILTAIDVVGQLAASSPVALVIAGDGPARAEVERAAQTVNDAHGREVIRLTGNLADPRPAYAAADVVLGMGGSALRAMAYAKALVVQGENGFWEVLDERTAPQFLWTGWYGHGDGSERGPDRLRDALGRLLTSPERRADLGAYGRRLVERRFALPVVAGSLHLAYEQVRMDAPQLSIADQGRAFGRWGRYQVDKRVRRLRGRAAADDFNAKPVASRADAVVPAPAPDTERDLTSDQALLYFAGVSWDAVKGTDRHLVEHVARRRPVVWVDPPTSLLRGRDAAARVKERTQLGPDLLRVHPWVLPGVSRPVLRRVAHDMAARRGLAAVRAWGRGLGGVVVSSPLQLPPRMSGDVPVVYFETDDFVAGADLFGVSRQHLMAQRARNLARATVVLAVTDDLAADLGTQGQRPWATLPNGCEVSIHERGSPAEISVPRPRAGVVGQFNDRLDLALLEGVAATGRSLVLIGPRRELSGMGNDRFASLVALPNVEWVGQQDPEDLPRFLAALDVGLTPYADSAFNRASFPLKTLEYMAAGLPVVTTALPAAYQLGTTLISIATNPEDFVAATVRELDHPGDQHLVGLRRDFAGQHTWEARAATLLGLIDDAAARRPDP